VITTYDRITLDMFWNPTLNPHLFKASNEN